MYCIHALVIGQNDFGKTTLRNNGIFALGKSVFLLSNQTFRQNDDGKFWSWLDSVHIISLRTNVRDSLLNGSECKS